MKNHILYIIIKYLMDFNDLLNIDSENYDQRFLLIQRILKSLEFMSKKSE